MCQLCDEANAYLAQLEDASKKPAAEERKPAKGKDAPVQEGSLQRGRRFLRRASIGGIRMTATAGYSGTPLAQKLGLKDGQRVLFIDLPESLNDLSTSRAFRESALAGWETWRKGEPGYDFVHGFTASRKVLEDNARPLMDSIARDGTIWVSWPKKASKVPTDITEDVIRDVVLPIGLVDVKVAAVDEIWSGLKLVIRKELR